MENNKKLTYEELLKETIVFYSEDVSRRGIDSNTGQCVYLDKTTGNQCAVGRCINHDLRKEYEGDLDLMLESTETTFEELLLPKYRHLTDLYFWNLLQGFHDNSDNWNTNGLTESGEKKYLYLLGIARELDNE